MRKRVRLARLFAEVFGAVLQAGQAGFHARVLAEHGHFQARLHAPAVGVHLRDQRVGGGLLGQAQQALEATLLPAQAQQAQRYGKPGSQGEAPGMAQPVADQEAHLADQDERQPVLQHRQPLVPAWYRRLALVDALVQRLGAADLLGGRLDPHRLEADYLVVVEDRRDIGVDPVVVAGLAAVLDDTHPRLALLEGLPHVGKHRWRYVGVAHQVVRRTGQFFAGETTDLDEGIVAVSDHTFGIGGGDQPLLGRESPFSLGNRLVVTHGLIVRRAFDWYRQAAGFIE